MIRSTQSPILPLSIVLSWAVTVSCWEDDSRDSAGARPTGLEIQTTPIKTQHRASGGAQDKSGEISTPVATNPPSQRRESTLYGSLSIQGPIEVLDGFYIVPSVTAVPCGCRYLADSTRSPRHRISRDLYQTTASTMTSPTNKPAANP